MIRVLLYCYEFHCKSWLMRWRFWLVLRTSPVRISATTQVTVRFFVVFLSTSRRMPEHWIRPRPLAPKYFHSTTKAFVLSCYPVKNNTLAWYVVVKYEFFQTNMGTVGHNKIGCKWFLFSNFISPYATLLSSIIIRHQITVSDDSTSLYNSRSFRDLRSFLYLVTLLLLDAAGSEVTCFSVLRLPTFYTTQ